MNPGDTVVKAGDILLISFKKYPNESRQESGPILGMCMDSDTITCHNHYGSYRGIRVLTTDGNVVVYPVEAWEFEVVA